MCWTRREIMEVQMPIKERLVVSPVKLWRKRRRESESSSVPALFGYEAQEREVYNRLKRAAVAGESTSLILCGYSGCGKHLLLARVLERLEREKEVPDYDVVHLSGEAHADASVALREVVRQIAARTESHRLASRYVDDLKVLVDELHRRRAEESAPLLVVLSRLELFASEHRQTLLYVLLDAIQSKEGCVVVVGITSDRHVLELFEKRVRSRLHNVHVSFGHVDARAVLSFLDDRLLASEETPYAVALAESWTRVKASPEFARELEDAIAVGMPVAWHAKVATLAVAALAPRAPLLTVEGWLRAVNDNSPNRSANWIKAIAALKPARLALVLAYLRFERDDKTDYNLDLAAKELAKLRQLNASAVCFHDDVLLKAQAALISMTVLKLGKKTARADARALEPATLRYAPVRLTGAVSLEDLFTALRQGALDCPTVLRQWVLQDVVA
ncbi:hypothetical protein CTAYLR_007782 [Chrysophaeum taylorii]|uniref:Nephrocystin 3-like N-terminal domain-containing protein n=1 Tax=Chrysophaeum taylorii TaxID=2483200 RepID=A0AAD7UIX4_9STRA|nr:hypothetical protein CTAYLR_007782 [Chrysophaeum taylorii]